jgi:hypothetical protein
VTTLDPEASLAAFFDTPAPPAPPAPVPAGIPLDTGPPPAPPSVTGRDAPKRDGKDRYLIAGPDGKVRGYTRSTTIAGTLDDTYELGRWQMAKVAYGLGRRPDLVDLAAGHDPDTDRQIYRTIVDEASAAAATTSAANTGTALHRFTELIDLDRSTIEACPERWHRHLRSYTEQMARIGFEVVADHVEQIVANDSYRIAGQIDRILRATRTVTIPIAGKTFTLPAGTQIVGDLKTGKVDDHRILKFSIQISIYANHETTWHPDHSHPDGGTRGPAIPLDTRVAIIIHLPAGNPDAPCDLYGVDLEAGYDAFLCAMEARAHRTNRRNLYARWDEHVSIETASAEWVRQRIAALAAHPEAVITLRLRWPNELRNPDGTLARFPDEPTADQINALAAVLDHVEDAHQVPFGPPRPKSYTPNPHVHPQGT